MKDCAFVWMLGALCAAGCTSTPAQGISANSGGATAPAVAGTTAPSSAAGTSAAPPKAPESAAGSTASGAAGATIPVTSGAAGAAAGSGAAAGMGAAGRSSSGAADVRPDTPATGDGAPPGSFLFVYNIALRDLCTTCHSAMGLFSSPDLSSPTKAYDSLVGKDATTVMGNQCGGKGKLITPGNCETSILYSKLSQTTPLCGRHMPLSSDAMPTFVPKEGLEALCTWIKAGAKKD